MLLSWNRQNNEFPVVRYANPTPEGWLKDMNNPRSIPSQKSICVFAGAASGNSPLFRVQARQLGAMLAARQFKFVYGGGRTGLMGEFAAGALEAGGYVTGIIPRFLENLEVGNRTVQELDVVENMHERKAKMYAQSDAFVILPGGLGTMDEMMEVLTWNQLGLINAPVFILNIEGYWNNVIAMLEHASDAGFVHSKGLYHFTVSDDADDLADNLEKHFQN